MNNVDRRREDVGSLHVTEVHPVLIFMKTDGRRAKSPLRPRLAGKG
jgi:hypothetical protein